VEEHLPQDPRTLLRTPVAVGKEISTLAGGELWYQGIQRCLKYHFRSDTPSVDTFAINLFVDGLPLHNAGPTQLWPIMMQVHDLTDLPIFVVGIFCGSSKPDNVEDFLRPLVDELNHLIEAGFTINQKRISVTFRAFIADTPARAFIKGKLYTYYI
uniref:Uncharacterized protein n=1 Tax=Anopheles epiroticus TaxID=199890 RepID=A0A182PWU2_9DIPT